MRTIRYREIAEEIRRRIEGGEFAAGRLLPSEAELSGAYDASRVTVRKALEALRQDGLVDSRQGFGWFVAADPLRQPLGQPLGRLGTVESQLEASGRAPSRQILDFGFVKAPARVRRLLGDDAPAEVKMLRVRRLNLADGQPFARITVWCREDLGASLSRADVERASFTELLPPGTVVRATQTIGAAAASADDAALFGVPEGAPVLCCDRVTRDNHGDVVLVSEHVFPGHLTEFVIELTGPDASRLTGEGAPPGLRRVH